ncbi:MAG: hypothetical protein EPO61_10805 [Nitrospirae bacterium]|nr:MAG: hypothetical protein EPO61_10805 [Nitrospirota bacterium]
MTCNRIACAGILFALLVGCTTKTADSDGITEHFLWPWEKVTQFCDRNDKYQQWMAEALESDQKQQMVKLVQWTRKKVVLKQGAKEEHIATTIERGYGSSYQQAEVFSLLAAYMGYEVRWAGAQPPVAAKNHAHLIFMKAQRGWIVIDITNGGWFETKEDQIATIKEFEDGTQLHVEGDIKKAIAGDTIKGDEVPYRAYFSNLPEVFKAEGSSIRSRKQMPCHRIYQILGFEEEG